MGNNSLFAQKKALVLLLAALTLAGCATSARYTPYTGQKFPAKDRYYFVNVYPESQHLPSTQPYYVIGRVDIEGYAGDGISFNSLTNQAKDIARKRGAEAIINAKTETFPYGGVYVAPGYIGRHYYHPPRYIPYGDTLLTFAGDLIVFTAAATKDNR